jgi:hypothetical protein
MQGDGRGHDLTGRSVLDGEGQDAVLLRRMQFKALDARTVSRPVLVGHDGDRRPADHRDDQKSGGSRKDSVPSRSGAYAGAVLVEVNRPSLYGNALVWPSLLAQGEGADRNRIDCGGERVLLRKSIAECPHFADQDVWVFPGRSGDLGDLGIVSPQIDDLVVVGDRGG